MINENEYSRNLDMKKMRDLENLAMRRRITEHALDKQGEIVKIYASLYRRYCTSLWDFDEKIKWVNRIAGSPLDDEQLQTLLSRNYSLNWRPGKYLYLRKPYFEPWGRAQVIELLEIDRSEQRIMEHYYIGAEKEQRKYYRTDGAKKKREYRARKKLENAKIVSEADDENADFEEPETGQN